MHEHPNFHGLPADADPAVGLSDAYQWIDGFGNETNEGWRRIGWYTRARTAVGYVTWQVGNLIAMAPHFNRSCDVRVPGPVIDWRTNAPAAPVDDTFLAFFPRVSYNDSTVMSVGRWYEQQPQQQSGGPSSSAECVDQVQLGCFNGGTCVAPDTCRCAPGWEGDDCSLPICYQTSGNVTSAPLSEIPLTLLRSPLDVGQPLSSSAPLQPGDTFVQYFKCPHNGNCTHPNVCTCEKGWSGANCSVPLCAQECLNGGYCSAPDVCTCPQWPSSVRDARGVPVYQKPDGSPQDSGWTGYDCGTPICVQAKEWIQNDDTGRRLIVLETTANDGKSFQGGCGPDISKYSASLTRISPQYLCGLTQVR